MIPGGIFPSSRHARAHLAKVIIESMRRLRLGVRVRVNTDADPRTARIDRAQNTSSGKPCLQKQSQ